MGHASIVVTANRSEGRRGAVSVACALAKQQQASVTVVIVVPQMAATVAAMSVTGGRYARQAWGTGRQPRASDPRRPRGHRRGGAPSRRG